MKKSLFLFVVCFVAVNSFAQTSNSSDGSKLKEMWGYLKSLTLVKDSNNLTFGSSAKLLIDGEVKNGSLLMPKSLLGATFTVDSSSSLLRLDGKLTNIGSGYSLYLSEKPTEFSGKYLKVTLAAGSSTHTYELYVGIKGKGLIAATTLKKALQTEAKIVL